jgi:DNA-binding NtrC family response regulator
MEARSLPPWTAEGSPASRILVVDDEFLVRWSIVEILGDCGHKVTWAVDGRSAIEACAATNPTANVVLLDLRLPDCDDLEVLRQIRRTSPTTRVIVMTAFATPELADQATALGAYAVIGKPFDLYDLASLVECALAA